MKKLYFLLGLASLVSSTRLAAQGTEFYCPTQLGGIYGGGALFSVDGSGNNYQKRYDYDYVPGEDGQIDGYSLCEGSNGKLYGQNDGGLYEYDVVANKMYEKWRSPYMTTTYGTDLGGLTNAPNNKVYGVFSKGGMYGKGFLFEYDYINDIGTVKFHFDGTTTGGNPETRLLLASNGKMYGTTRNGANGQNAGCVFEYDYNTNAFTKKADFNGLPGQPGAVTGMFMAEGSNQKIYGTCISGGTNNGGTIWSYDINTFALALEHDFNTTPNVYYAVTGVVLANNGKLYGTCQQGGTGNGGLFEYDYNSSTFNQAVAFSTAQGSYCKSRPLPINNKLYFTTAGGGANTYGTYVAYNTSSSTLSVLYNYSAVPGPISPKTSIMRHSNGKLYMISESYPSYNGQLVQLDTLGNITILQAFKTSPMGANPAELAYAYGNLYGCTQNGGTDNLGTIYKFDPVSHVYTKLWDFDQASGNGQNPYGPMIQSSGTSLYGIAIGGGVNGAGQLYEFDVNSSIYTPLLDLDGSTIGSYPSGYIVKHGNGRIYGTTTWGGTNNKGTIFEYDPGTALSAKRYDFNTGTNGDRPEGIVLGANGKIYGTTDYGGTNNNGVIFEFTPPSTFVKKYNFALATGGYPTGRMVEPAPGIFYGTTQNGGANGKGVLYKFKVSSSTYTKLIDFDSTNYGSNPIALALGAGGKIYGTTSRGGTYDQGVVFEFDTASLVMVKKVDLYGANGSIGGPLTLVCGTTTYDAGTSGSFCKNGQYVLGTTPDVGYSYSWNPTTGLSGATTANPTVTVQSTPITYTVTESYLGCVSTDQITINPLLPQTPEICLVTDDSADVYNHVIWEKSLYSGVDSFIVYREVSTNTYVRIGAVSKDSLSDFTDTARQIGPANGDPRITTYRYKLSIKDTCGNEGPLSASHTTVYFVDLHNGSFQWNTYSVSNMTVTPITTFDLLRDSNNTGYWKVIGTCAGTSNILNDPQYSTFQNIANWRVQAHGISCNPTLRQGNNQNQATIVKSKSNICNNRTMGVKTQNEKGIGIYPNPFSDKFTITSEEQGSITVHNALGESVYEGTLTERKTTIDLGHITSGVYNAVIKTEKGGTVKRIVKQ